MSKGERSVPAAHLGAEEPVHEVGVRGQMLRPQHRVAVRLQIDLDLVADSGVHVIRPGEDEQAPALLARAPGQRLPRGGREPRVEGAKRAVGLVHRARHLGRRQPGQCLSQSLEELLGHELRLVERHERCDVADPLLREDVALLEEPGLDVLGRRHHARTREGARHVAAQERGQRVDHRGEQDVELLPLPEDQLTVVTGDAFHGVTAVHGPAPLAELPALLLRRVRGEYEPPALDPEGAEQAHPELMGGPEVQDARDADTKVSARRRGVGGRRPGEPSRQR